MKILMAEQMRRIDELTVERCAIPYLTLMETAGSRVVEAIFGQFSGRKFERFVIICGKGNNGGDGAVVARQLWLRKLGLIEVCLVGSIDEMRGAARTNMEIVGIGESIGSTGWDGSCRCNPGNGDDPSGGRCSCHGDRVDQSDEEGGGDRCFGRSSIRGSIG